VQQTVIKAVRVSFPADPHVRGERRSGPPAQAEENSASGMGAPGKTPPEEPEARPVQDNAPPTEAHQATATNDGTESNDSGNNEADQEVREPALRATFIISLDEDTDGSEEDFWLWDRALNVTDAMKPGFKAYYIQFWLDRREEDEDVPKPEPKPEQKQAENKDESSFEDFSDAGVIDNGTRQQPGTQPGSDERPSSPWV